MHNLESRLEVGFGADSVRAGVWVWVWRVERILDAWASGLALGRLWHRRVFALRSKDLNCKLRID